MPIKLLPIVPLSKKQIKTFWRYIEVNSYHKCWIWKGDKSDGGYGRVRIYYNSKEYPYVASRIMYLLHYGKDPGDLYVLHNCPDGDNPSCVNPFHLWLGSTQDNVLDCLRKGRGNKAKGSRNGMNSQPKKDKINLTDNQIIEIIELYKTGTISQSNIGIKFGVSAACVSYIVNDKRKRVKLLLGL